VLSVDFAQIGGIDPKFLPSKRVRIGRNRIVGIIGAKPVHLSKKGNSATYSDLYLDCGFQNREEAEALIQIGDGAVFDTDCDIFDDQRTFILGKALDNRIGVALLCELIQDDRIENGTFVFTTQEEVGLRGATAFMEANRFKIGIALDTTTANDLPAVLPQNTVTSLNKGGTVSFADGATIYNRDLIRFVTDALMQQKIPWQTKMKRTGGNDAAAIDRAGVGALSISLSTPCRYIHSAIGVVKSSDIEDTYSALLSILSSAEAYGDA